MKVVKLVLVLLLIAALGFTGYWLWYRKQPEFNGSRVRNPDAYTLSASCMNMTDSYAMQANAGDLIRVTYDVKRGSMALTVGTEGSEPIYTGRCDGAASFTLNISESGMYTFTVKASNMAGEFSAEVVQEDTKDGTDQ